MMMMVMGGARSALYLGEKKILQTLDDSLLVFASVNKLPFVVAKICLNWSKFVSLLTKPTELVGIAYSTVFPRD